MAETKTTLKPDRVLGKTGVRVPPIEYGTSPLGKADKVPPAEALKLINYAIDCGITYIDTSPDYGSEPHVGEVMKSRRNEVFLATKVNNRSRESVLQEIKGSLEKLQTDHVDLIQIHAVNAWADLEMALAKDGTVPALEQAHIDEIVENASRIKPLDETEMERLIGQVRPLLEQDAKASQGEGGEGAKPPLFWLHDTAVMGWKQRDEPASVSY